MNCDELFDIVDNHDIIIGQATRSYVHAQLILHRAVHIWVLNKSGKILIQKRSMLKDRFPGRWTSSVSGHVDSGEHYLHAAHREMFEEIGWLDPVNLTEIAYARACDETEQEFIRLYITHIEGPFKIDPDEVVALDWQSPEELDLWIAKEPDAFTISFIYLWNHYQKLIPTQRHLKNNT